MRHSSYVADDEIVSTGEHIEEKQVPRPPESTNISSPHPVSVIDSSSESPTQDADIDCRVRHPSCSTADVEMVPTDEHVTTEQTPLFPDSTSISKPSPVSVIDSSSLSPELGSTAGDDIVSTGENIGGKQLPRSLDGVPNRSSASVEPESGGHSFCNAGDDVHDRSAKAGADMVCVPASQLAELHRKVDGMQEDIDEMKDMMRQLLRQANVESTTGGEVSVEQAVGSERESLDRDEAGTAATEGSHKLKKKVRPCAHCGEVTHRRCAGCKITFYCSISCQKACFSAHKTECVQNN